MTTGELTNTKFNTTKTFIMYNREKDRMLLKKIATMGTIVILGFLAIRKAVG